MRKNPHSQALSLSAFLLCSAAYAQSEYLKAYPNHIVRATKNQLIWKDSTVMPFDDGQKKNVCSAAPKR